MLQRWLYLISIVPIKKCFNSVPCPLIVQLSECIPVCVPAYFSFICRSACLFSCVALPQFHSHRLYQLFHVFYSMFTCNSPICLSSASTCVHIIDSCRDVLPLILRVPTPCSQACCVCVQPCVSRFWAYCSVLSDIIPLRLRWNHIVAEVYFVIVTSAFASSFLLQPRKIDFVK